MPKSKRLERKTRSNNKKLSTGKSDPDEVSAEWWERRRQDIILELSKDAAFYQTITFHFGRAAIPGSMTLETYHNDFPMPLAIMWYTLSGLNQIQINNLYTFEPLRRCGLMAATQKFLLRCFPTRSLVTCCGTELGKPWMFATGWKKTAAGYEHPANQPT